MSENRFNINPVDLELLYRLKSPRSYYGKWRENFAKLGKKSAYSGEVIYPDYKNEFLPDSEIQVSPDLYMSVPPTVFDPSIQEVSVGAVPLQEIETALGIIDVGVVVISKLLRSGGVLVRYRNTGKIDFIQFGQSGIDAESTFGPQEQYKRMRLTEDSALQIEIKQLNEYTPDYDVYMIRDAILNSLGLSEPKLLRKMSRSIVQNEQNLDEVFSLLTDFIDQEYLEKVSNNNSIWRGKRRGFGHLIYRHEVAEQVIEMVIKDNIIMRRENKPL